MTDTRAAFIRRAVHAIRRRANILVLERLTERIAEAHARGDGSEGALADLLARADELEAARLREVIAAEPRPADERDSERPRYLN
jgi:hypothetical protein